MPESGSVRRGQGQQLHDDEPTDRTWGNGSSVPPLAGTTARTAIAIRSFPVQKLVEPGTASSVADSMSGMDHSYGERANAAVADRAGAHRAVEVAAMNDIENSKTGTSPEVTLVDNPSHERFELLSDDELVGILGYRDEDEISGSGAEAGDVVAYMHTVVKEEYGGQDWQPYSCSSQWTAPVNVIGRYGPCVPMFSGTSASIPSIWNCSSRTRSPRVQTDDQAPRFTITRDSRSPERDRWRPCLFARFDRSRPPRREL